MQYLLMIYQSESDAQLQNATAANAISAEYGVLTQSLKDGGTFVGGNALQPIATATTVRVRDGKTVTTDGPFAETREQLGGYYLIDAAHLDDAIAIAARIPSARFGSIEVRPVRVYPVPA